MTLKEFGVSAVTAAILTVSGAAVAADSGTVVANQAKTTKSSQASQQKIDTYAESTEGMLAEYKGLLRQIDSMKSTMSKSTAWFNLSRESWIH